MHTSERGQWSRYEESAYRQARREGMPLGVAFHRALSERVAHKILPPSTVHDGAGATSWRLDAGELARATHDARTDALFGIVHDGTTGERILSRVSLPGDARTTITVRDDLDASPHDAECYGPDDVEAWRNDAWRYVSVEAVVTLADGRQGISAIGAVECGEHWGTSWEAAIIHTVPSLVGEALAEIATTYGVCQTCGNSGKALDFQATHTCA